MQYIIRQPQKEKLPVRCIAGSTGRAKQKLREQKIGQSQAGGGCTAGIQACQPRQPNNECLPTNTSEQILMIAESRQTNKHTNNKLTVASTSASRLSNPQKRAISCCSTGEMLLWRGSKLRGGVVS